MVIGSVWHGFGYELIENYITGFFIIGPMLWLIFWLCIAVIWMLIHFNDTDGTSHHSSSSGIDGPRLIRWYTRYQVRKGIRKLMR